MIKLSASLFAVLCAVAAARFVVILRILSVSYSISHSYYYFSSSMSFSKIPKRFSSLT